MRIHVQQFFNWPYDEALEWMDTAFLKVKTHPQNIFIAVASHKERVITLGRNLSLNILERNNLDQDILVRSLERGGGVTAHEPGQLVLYPVLNIFELGLSVADLIAIVEKAMLDFLKHLGIDARNFSQGVFIDDQKVGFLGLRITEGITSHGLAINLFNDAKIFKLFNPCGVAGMPVTSAYLHAQLPESIEHYAAMLEGCFCGELKKYL